MNFKCWLEAAESSVSRLSQMAVANGWKYEPVTLGREINPKSVSVGSVVYPTLVNQDGVMIALDVMDRYKHSGRILLGDYLDVSPNRVTLAAIITPGENRKRGMGSKALQQLQTFADNLGIVIVGEPVQMKQFKNKESLTTKQLIKWYKKHGWKQRIEGDDSILEYRPSLPA